MKKSIDKIVTSSKKRLVLYTIASFLFLTVYVWWVSFAWQFMFTVDDH